MLRKKISPITAGVTRARARARALFAATKKERERVSLPM